MGSASVEMQSIQANYMVAKLAGGVTPPKVSVSELSDEFFLGQYTFNPESW